MTGIRTTAYGAPLVEALRAAIAEAKGLDPLVPVTVVAPSNVAGLSLRRELARAGPPGVRGLVNVRFMVFARLAELIAAPAVVRERPRPLAPLVRAEATRQALAEAPGPFAGVAGHPATVHSLDSVFRELAAVPPASLDAFAARGGRPAHLVALFRRFRALTADRYDELDLFASAAGAVAGDSPVLRDLGHVVLLQVRPFATYEEELARALEQAGRAVRIVALTGEPPLDAALSPRPGGAGLAATGVTILATSDTDVEVRSLVREVLAALRAGTPAHRVGVFYRLSAEYEPVLRDAFAAAGIPFNGPVSATLGSTGAGRMLRGAFRVAERDFRRDDLLAWLSAAPVRPGGRAAPVRIWDAVAREAGVVRGLDQWQQRLSRYATAEEARAKEAEEQDRLSLAAGARRRATASRELAAFMVGLAARLRLPMVASWPEWAARAREVLAAYFHLDPRAGEDEEEALHAVRDALGQVEALGDFRDAVTAADFLAALDQLLASPAARHGRFGTGVFAGPLRLAPGLQFDLVFIVGLVEGQLPSGGEDDPLLPEREREALAPHVSPPAERRREERRTFLAALQCAPRRVLSFPAAALRGQRKNLPSRWLLEIASLLARRRVDTEAFENLPPAPWLRRVPSFQAAVQHDGTPANAQEYDLRSLGNALDPRRHYLAEASLTFQAGLRMPGERRRPRYTRWDGLVGAAEAPSLTSPTRLERWLRCPFAYFLEDVLRIEGRDDPSDAVVLSPIDRGNIIHQSLERFFRERAGRAGAGSRWTGDDRHRLLEIAGAVCDEVEQAGRAGKPTTWHVERARILADLEAFLGLDEGRRARLGFAAAEFAFGPADANPPVELRLPSGRGLAFRGRIDRIDRSPGGESVVVYEYKSGSPGPYEAVEGDLLAGGRRLQLAVYAEAARAAFSARNVEAHYWFVSATGQKVIGGAANQGVRDRLGAVLDTALDGIRAGTFPANPGAWGNGAFANCRFCPYDALCPPDRGRQWERKRDDPAVAAYVALGEPRDPEPATEEPADD